MDGWTIAVIVTFAIAMTVCLRRNEIAQSIARMINASREEVMLQIMDETLKEKYSNDEHKRRLAFHTIDGEHGPELLYSDDFYHVAESLKIMATAGRISIASQHQEIEPYTPPEPLPRYEIVMIDDWQSRDEEEHASSNDPTMQKVHERSQS